MKKRGNTADPAAALARLQRAWSLGGKTGGSKGGKVRAAKLTAKQRSAIARKGALARWAKAKTAGKKKP